MQSETPYTSDVFAKFFVFYMESEQIIVLKIGTHTLIDEAGNIRPTIISSLFTAALEAKKGGSKVLLVTSGAVGLGRREFAGSNPARAVAGGVGQAQLIAEYVTMAKEFNITISQILLSRPHFLEREHFLTMQTLIRQMCSAGVIPIINENDALVADTDWSFGDNDSLSATLSVSLGAKELILITHIDGLFTDDPRRDPGAKLITEADDINRELMKYCSDTVSANGRGGMLSKLKAARICTNAGVAVRIVNGLADGALLGAIRGEAVGTFCKPRIRTRSLSNLERWIIVAKSSAATIQVDDGAVAALRQRKSLLAVGIRKLFGSFAAGESVEVVDKNNDGVAFGIVDASAEDLLAQQFCDQHGAQVMHANSIIVF